MYLSNQWLNLVYDKLLFLKNYSLPAGIIKEVLKSALFIVLKVIKINYFNSVEEKQLKIKKCLLSGS